MPCGESTILVDPLKLRIFCESTNLGNWSRKEKNCQGHIKEELLLFNDSICFNSETNRKIYCLNFSLCIFENFKHIYVHKNAFIKCLTALIRHLFPPHIVRMILTTPLHLEWIFDQKLKETKSPLFKATPKLVSMNSKLNIYLCLRIDFTLLFIV